MATKNDPVQLKPNLTASIWKDLHDKLRSFIYGKVPDKAVADDILQEVFIRIHLKIDTLKDESKLVPWVYQIVRNQLSDYFRSTKKQANMRIAVSEEEENQNDLSAMEKAVRDMIHTMNDLPPEYCEALCMTELEGLSQAEYAERLGIPYSSAKSRVQRSRKLLRDMLMKCCHYQFDKYGTVLSISPNRCCCCNPVKS